MWPLPGSPAKSQHRQAVLNSSLAVLPFQVELISSGPALGNTAGISAVCCSSTTLKRIYSGWRCSPEVWMNLSCTVVQGGREKHTPLTVAENRRLWGYKRLLSHGDSFFPSLSTPKLICGALTAADAALCWFENHFSVCPLCNVHLSIWFPISSAVIGKMTPSGAGVLCVWTSSTREKFSLMPD